MGCGALALIKHTFAISRRIPPELCLIFRALENRGRGECRVPNAPAARAQEKLHTVVTTGTPESPGIPCAVV
jgi:hypothetical protein